MSSTSSRNNRHTHSPSIHVENKSCFYSMTLCIARPHCALWRLSSHIICIYTMSHCRRLFILFPFPLIYTMLFILSSFSFFIFLFFSNLSLLFYFLFFFF